MRIDVVMALFAVVVVGSCVFPFYFRSVYKWVKDGRKRFIVNYDGNNYFPPMSRKDKDLVLKHFSRAKVVGEG